MERGFSPFDGVPSVVPSESAFWLGAKSRAGGFSNHVLVAAGDIAAPAASVSCFAPAPLSGGGAAADALPRMIGRPSLLLPKITTFELLDCASCNVASIPRQRRYESEIPY